jgi:hypothetical protein
MLLGSLETHGSPRVLPVQFTVSAPDPSLSLDYVLSALADGSLEPVPDTGDNPSWSAALASPDKEYWVAGARNEIHSLKEL